MKPNHNYITNPVFIFCLVLLLFNDFYLKEIYHNWVTGKLSDISGIIVFTFFFTAIRSDLKKYIFTLTIILFAFWKTEYCQFLIDSWNTLSILQIDRTIDYTDILCLSVLIPLYWYSPNSVFTNLYPKKIISYPIIIITLFAIVATSKARHIPADIIYVNKYVKVKSSQDFFLNQLDKDKISYTITDSIFVIKKDTMKRVILENIIINEDTIHSATVGILDKGNHLKIYVKSLKVNEKSHYNLLDFKEYKKWAKKYRIENKKFLQEIKE